MGFLWYIIISIAAGFLAGKIMRRGGFGVIINLISGIVGGVLGGWRLRHSKSCKPLSQNHANLICRAV